MCDPLIFARGLTASDFHRRPSTQQQPFLTSDFNLVCRSLLYILPHPNHLVQSPRLSCMMAAAVYESRPPPQRYAYQYAPTSRPMAPPAVAPIAPVASVVPPPPATEQPRAGSSQEKFVPPEPPLRIRDSEGGKTYIRVGFLGEVSV